MEINERFLTLLTPEGEFLRARKQDRAYVIGQEIHFFPIEQKSGKKSSFLSIFNIFRGNAIFAAAFALMLAAVSLLSFYQSNEVYAYMSIDVNPSIELGVNEKYQVIELVPYNKDGELIVQKIQDWKKKNIQAVTDKILYQLKKQGYFGENKEIVIATVYTENKIESDKRLQIELTKIKEAAQKEQLAVTLFEATKEDREAAIEKGLTTGVYKENELKTESKKPPKKGKPATIDQSKENSLEDSNTLLEIPPGQLKKSEKPEAKQESIKNKNNNPAAPGQINKNDKQEKQTANKGNKNIERNQNKGSQTSEKKNKQNVSSRTDRKNPAQKLNKGNSENGNGANKKKAN